MAPNTEGGALKLPSVQAFKQFPEAPSITLIGNGRRSKRTEYARKTVQVISVFRCIGFWEEFQSS